MSNKSRELPTNYRMIFLEQFIDTNMQISPVDECVWVNGDESIYTACANTETAEYCVNAIKNYKALLEENDRLRRELASLNTDKKSCINVKSEG